MISIQSSQIRDELICCICQSVPIESSPIACKAAHTICETCVTQMCPNGIAMEKCPICRISMVDFIHWGSLHKLLRGKLNIKCMECDENILFDKYKEHLRICPLSETHCDSILCVWNGYRKDLQQHIQTCASKKFELTNDGERTIRLLQSSLHMMNVEWVERVTIIISNLSIDHCVVFRRCIRDSPPSNGLFSCWLDCEVSVNINGNGNIIIYIKTERSPSTDIPLQYTTDLNGFGPIIFKKNTTQTSVFIANELDVVSDKIILSLAQLVR